jgi:tetratricopeptide (TPR) repeat protein
MKKGNASLLPESRVRHWCRVLRPLFWWLLLVLVLCGYRTHERLLSQTRLRFTIQPDGPWSAAAAEPMLDNSTVGAGQRVSLGRHRFEITHPKAEPFSTNLFIWYGGRDLGTITLKRTRGILAVELEPPAASVSIQGAEFSVMLTNSIGLNSPVPTDVYSVEAHWANHGEMQRVRIDTGRTSSLRFAPPLGGLTLESDPPGATVIAKNGQVIGTTPLTLGQMPAGPWAGELRLEGHIPVPLELVIGANRTNSVRTNLVNWQYAQAMETARQSSAAGQHDRALEALAAALKAKPNDPDATALQGEVTLTRHLRRTTELRKRGDYAAAGQEANAVLAAQPENAEAKALLADMQKRREELAQQEQRKRDQTLAQRQLQERLTRFKTMEASLGTGYVDANLFQTYELTSAKSVKETGQAIRDALSSGQPAFEVARYDWPEADTFTLEAKQGMLLGLRQCLVFGTQTREGETRIAFKVVEYQTHLNLGLGALLGPSKRPDLTAIHPSRIAELTSADQARLKEGVAIVSDRIRKAIGQASARNP